MDAAGGTEAPEASLPEGLQALLLRRIEALAPEARRVLEAASVVGEAFAVAAVAAGSRAPSRMWRRCVTGWRRNGTSSATLGGRSGRMAPAVGPIAFSIRSTARCCMSAWAPCGASSSTDALGHGWRAAMAPRRARSPPSSPCTSSALARSAGRALWQQTGEMARDAYPEALTALRKGLTLLATLPESPTRMQDELTLLLSLGELLIAAKGLAAPDVGDVYVYVQAQRLCHRLGEAPQPFQVLKASVYFISTRPSCPPQAPGQELTDLAHRQHEAGPVLTGRATMGTVALFHYWRLRGCPGPPGVLLLVQ